MISLYHGLILVFMLLALGVFSLLIRGNLLYILISLEIMVNAIALAFVIIGNYWGQTDGQLMYIIIITIAAAEIGVGLVVLMHLYKKYKTLNIDFLSEMHL
ncbi:NADH-quinone oxidoreductase subunit NuoK [Buchnera aphidicola (Mollitrichosiphum nigrofasciatum)]|uniref:NADH-quinone oxidoreductase subunit NuoK n=1 Tax=Buchnera aphidicola TaxID=9 RepID=UPI0031B82F01